MDLRTRSLQTEILDDPNVPERLRARCYRDLARTHRWLGNNRAIIERIRRDPLPVRTVLDVGCAHGDLLREIRAELGVEVVGVDALPPHTPRDVTILRRDAIRDPLPRADVAVALTMIHHLTPAELTALIRNAGRSCRRFLILDLVRHSLPSALFRVGVAPFVHRINGQDGMRSLERAFTPRELQEVVRDALAGTRARFHQTVAPFKVRQIVDIRYELREGM